MPTSRPYPLKRNSTISSGTFPLLLLFSAILIMGWRFAKILWISHDTFEAHVQWFEHASGLFLQEFAHDQHLYLTHLCGEIPLGSFLGKVNVHWKVPVERWKTVGFHDFVCK